MIKHRKTPAHQINTFYISQKRNGAGDSNCFPAVFASLVHHYYKSFQPSTFIRLPS